jgi:hypothetical protein
VELVFWCLSNTPRVSKESVVIECDGKAFDRETVTLDGERIALEPAEYPRIKSPSIRLRWITEVNLRNTLFSTDIENAYLLEWGMGQEMVHVAGSIAQVGINMIGGVYVDIVPMDPHLTSKPPDNYRIGNLPEPLRDGVNSAVECIEGWRASKTFKLGKVSDSKLGQLLWAGCGCTPHKTFRYHRYGMLTSEGQGKTIPSASATYTTSLYMISKGGIHQYVNWDKEKGVATHSLEKIKEGDQLNTGEYREGAWSYTGKNNLLREVQKIIPSLPKAHTYIVVASNGRLQPFFSLMEAGYSILHIVLQAHALNLASNIVILSQDQITKIKRTIGLIDTPIAFVSIGLS